MPHKKKPEPIEGEVVPDQRLAPWTPPPGYMLVPEDVIYAPRTKNNGVSSNGGRIAIVAIAFFLFWSFLLVGAILGTFWLTRPTPIPTIPVQITAQWTERPTVTLTPTLTATPTPDATETMEASGAWAAIHQYFQYLTTGDFGSAWHRMTLSCQYSVCIDNYFSDYQGFITFWLHTGPTNIQSLQPEGLTDTSAQAYVILFYKRQMQSFPYRFWLRYDSTTGLWMLDRIEYVTLMK